MALLTPGEYDDLPSDVKVALGQIVRQPIRDVKSTSYRRRYGPYMNGELFADPASRQVVGYGTGSPLAPK